MKKKIEENIVRSFSRKKISDAISRTIKEKSSMFNHKDTVQIWGLL